jgi:hypothetical protein
MTFERGDIHNPTGNAIIYWKIKGNNKMLKDAEYIASNFVVSALQVKDETLMVNFPPVLIENYEQLMEVTQKNNIDLIKGEDLLVPENIDDLNSFYKLHMEKYRGIIQEYVQAFKDKNTSQVVRMSIPQLITHANTLMAKIRTMVKYREKGKLLEKKIRQLGEIQDRLSEEMPGLNFNRLIRKLDNPSPEVDALVELYHQKLLAIFLEDYERAERLKKVIFERERRV